MVVPLGLLNTTPNVAQFFGPAGREALVAQYLANYPQSNAAFMASVPAQTLSQGRGVATQPPIEPVVAPVVEQPVQRPMVDEGESYSSFDMMGPNAPSISFGPDPSAVQAAEAFGPSDQTAEQIASAYADSQRTESPPGVFSALSNVFDQPVNQTIEQVGTALTGTGPQLISSMLPGGLGLVAGPVLEGMAQVNERNLAYDRAMTEMNQPGYSYGKIDGMPYSISPGPFGFGQVLSGVVPDYFDIDMAQSMQSVQEGIDPNTGTSIEPTAGVAGYNQKGDYIDAFGNVMAMGAIEDLNAMARNNNMTLAQATAALNQARSGRTNLASAIAEQLATDPSVLGGRSASRGGDFPSFDPSYDPNVPGSVPDINLDPLSAEMVDLSFDEMVDAGIDPGEASAAAAESLGYDADDDAGEGGFY